MAESLLTINHFQARVACDTSTNKFTRRCVIRKKKGIFLLCNKPHNLNFTSANETLFPKILNSSYPQLSTHLRLQFEGSF